MYYFVLQPGDPACSQRSAPLHSVTDLSCVVRSDGNPHRRSTSLQEQTPGHRLAHQPSEAYMCRAPVAAPLAHWLRHLTCNPRQVQDRPALPYVAPPIPARAQHAEGPAGLRARAADALADTAAHLSARQARPADGQTAGKLCSAARGRRAGVAGRAARGAAPPPAPRYRCAVSVGRPQPARKRSSSGGCARSCLRGVVSPPPRPPGGAPCPASAAAADTAACAAAACRDTDGRQRMGAPLAALGGAPPAGAAHLAPGALPPSPPPLSTCRRAARSHAARPSHGPTPSCLVRPLRSPHRTAKPRGRSPGAGTGGAMAPSLGRAQAEERGSHAPSIQVSLSVRAR